MADGRAQAALARLAGLPWWLRGLAAAAAGVLSAFALPPHGQLLVLPLAVPVLALLLATSRSWLRAGWTGWAFGFGQFVVGFAWIGNALLVDADRFAWLLPFTVALVPAGLALFPAIGVALARRAVPRAGLAQLVALAAGWVVAELLRAHLLTGFPWNRLGYVWYEHLEVLQGAALFGVYGLGFLTMLLAAAPAAFVVAAPARAAAHAVAWLAALAGLWLWGSARLDAADAYADSGVAVRVVQPNVAQRDKWRPDLRETHLRRLAELTAAPSPLPIAAVVWPETATPLFLDRHDVLRRSFAAALPAGAVLLAGSPRMQEPVPGGGAAARYFNSLLVIDRAGDVVAHYDKHHLVPFGEYVPLRPVLGMLGFERIVAGRGDFAPGGGPAVLSLPGLPDVQPLICYEAIFPHEVGTPRRPGWLLTITNDAWFGDSDGPHQHFQMARMRAVEQGLPLVRAANTGVSGVVDAFGRTVRRLELGSGGTIDAPLPRALPQPTPYARAGDAVPAGAALLLAGLAFLVRRQKA